MVIHRLLCIATLILPISFGHAAMPETSSPLAIQIIDSRPVPDNLIPVVTNAFSSDLAGPILPVTSGKNRSMWGNEIHSMKAVGNNSFITTGPVERDDYWLMIDHPGYLRGFSLKIPESTDQRTTVTVELPKRGAMLAELNLGQFQRDAKTDERWQEALKGYCISAQVQHLKPLRYCIDYRHSLDGWKFEVTDMAPGNYELFGTGRWCDAGGGPAGYAGKVSFEVKSGYLTMFRFPMTDRHSFSPTEQTTATMSFEPM